MNGEAPKFSVENLARAAAAWFPADCKILIFNSVYGVIYSHGCLQVPQQLTSLKQLFNSREAALQQGLTLDGQRFEVGSVP